MKDVSTKKYKTLHIRNELIVVFFNFTHTHQSLNGFMIPQSDGAVIFEQLSVLTDGHQQLIFQWRKQLTVRLSNRRPPEQLGPL